MLSFCNNHLIKYLELISSLFKLNGSTNMTLILLNRLQKVLRDLICVRPILFKSVLEAFPYSYNPLIMKKQVKIYIEQLCHWKQFA